MVSPTEVGLDRRDGRIEQRVFSGLPCRGVGDHLVDRVGIRLDATRGQYGLDLVPCRDGVLFPRHESGQDAVPVGDDGDGGSETHYFTSDKSARSFAFAAESGSVLTTSVINFPIWARYVPI